MHNCKDYRIRTLHDHLDLKIIGEKDIHIKRLQRISVADIPHMLGTIPSGPMFAKTSLPE